jgi:diguanylate cyclase
MVSVKLGLCGILGDWLGAPAVGISAMSSPSAILTYVNAAVFILLTVVFVAVVLRLQHIYQKKTLTLMEERHELESALHRQRLDRDQTEAPFEEFRERRLTEEIRERKKMEVKLQHAAFHDSLTGLHNRAFLIEAMAGVLREVRENPKARAELLYLNLDKVKSINDMCGHRTGDLLLIEIARRLKSFVREHDLVARVSGDEFALVVMNLNGIDKSNRLAQRLLLVIEQPITMAGMQIPITASIGICEMTPAHHEPDQVIRDAGTAMFHAKRNHGAQFVRYSAEMEENALVAMQARLQLKAAVVNQEFECFYQPLIDMRDNSIYGAESLIRWNHPTRGLLAPGAFIQLAEETGHIVQMGTWVMQQSFKDLQRLQQACDHKLTLSVNVSSKQLDLPNFMDTLTDALEESKINPRQVQLEITESIFLKDAARIGRLFQDIRQLGVQIAFDDFGTGYSSLSYLRTFPFDKIKIDQSFVRNIPSNPESMAIVRAVTRMGASLNIATTGEGVETLEELDFLKRKGCTEAQGYLFSKPKPAREVGAMLAEQAARTRVVA